MCVCVREGEGKVGRGDEDDTRLLPLPSSQESEESEGGEGGGTGLLAGWLFVGR